MAEYDEGDAPILIASFLDADLAAADPSTVQFQTLAPDGTTETTIAPDASITNPAEGEWRMQMGVLDQDGVWWWRAEGTAGLLAAGEASFIVRRSRFS